MSLFDELGLAPIDMPGIEDEDLKNKILEALMEVNDPELNVDIVNLGLVYEVKMDQNNNLDIKMTLTSMGCPLAGPISGQAAEALRAIPEINETKVDIIWNPPWDRNRVSKIAKMQLGIR